ncbi:glycosyltransferase family 39 protein [Thermoflexus sp.]|uniref:glycosyltransferase family 39 protein n=1 Tax=Thermoflexus sp. TaxID=1969742 RepID=UPI002ADDAF20|nr:glycosyltransferase family 39 protein [Thermoflexus sp.]
MAKARRNKRIKIDDILLWILLLWTTWWLWLQRLSVHDLSFDEVATWYIARRNLPDMIGYLQKAIFEHPPLYYVLMHFWMLLVGEQEFGLRMFSVITGVIALAALGWAVRRTPEWNRTGWVPALFLAWMPGFVYYARNARMYSLIVVLVVLSAGLFVRDWLNSSGRPPWSAIARLVAVHLLAVFTHYYTILPILIQPLALALLRRWVPLAVWIAGHGTLFLAGIVWLNSAPGLQASVQHFRLLYQFPQTQELYRLISGMIFAPGAMVSPSILVFYLALASVGIGVAVFRRRPALAVWLALELTVSLILAYQLPRVPAERYLLFWLPFLAWAMGLPILAFSRLSLSRQPVLAVMMALAVGSGMANNGLARVLNPQKGGYGHTLRQVQSCAQAGDGMLFYGPWQWLLFQYYDPGGLPPITSLPPQAPPQLSPEEARPVLEELLQRHQRLWVLPAAVDDVDPLHFAEGWLNVHAHRVWRTADFMLYLPPLRMGGLSRDLGIRFGSALRLDRVEWEADAMPAGRPLRLTLHWTALEALSGDVRVGLLLKDAQGNLWNSAHVIPQEWAYPPSRWKPGDKIIDRQGLMIPPGAPPGAYTVHLLVADERTGNPVAADIPEPIGLFSIRVEEPSAEAGSLDWRCAWPESQPLQICAPDGRTCIALVGAEYPDTLYPSYPIPITLHWLGVSAPLPDLELRVELLASGGWLGGSTIVSATLTMLPDYPSSRWPLGRAVSQKLQLPLPLEAPAGPALLRLEVRDRKGAAWTTEGQTSLRLSNLRIRERPVSRRPPMGFENVRVELGEELELRGYRIEGEARPGGVLRITYIWHVRSRPYRVYAVFNHLMTEDGRLVAQADGWPKGGHWLTDRWLPGDYIVDQFLLIIPENAPPGPYRLSTGMYDPQTGERLPALQDHHRLPEDRLYLLLPGNR